jgi:hypothetical protein
METARIQVDMPLTAEDGPGDALDLARRRHARRLGEARPEDGGVSRPRKKLEPPRHVRDGIIDLVVLLDFHG